MSLLIEKSENNIDMDSDKIWDERIIIVWVFKLILKGHLSCKDTFRGYIIPHFIYSTKLTTKTWSIFGSGIPHYWRV